MTQILGLSILLIPCIVTDLRNRTIPLLFVLTFSLIALLLNLLFSTLSLTEMIFGTIPGLLLLPISIFTGGAIGRGDCFLFLAIGIWCGFSMTMTVLLISLLAAGITGAVTAFCTKKGLKMTMPFAPFLAAGWLAELVRVLLQRV